MRYASVCSGIEAPSVAWAPLGWQPAWFSEIAPFPSAVLAHHYPDVPNLGDMTQIHTSEVFRGTAIDLLIGGTPCQAFSVAGLRGGLADPRGQLALVFLALVDRARPRWVVWENVPGVLSTDEGRAFGAFLGALGQLGYGFAYRVLDAQHCGVPQRRRRVFVVGHSGGAWQRAAAVLFERHSLSGDPPPSRAAGASVAACLTASAGSRGASGLAPEQLVPTVASGPPPPHGKGPDSDATLLLPIPLQEVDSGQGFQFGAGIGQPGDPMYTLLAQRRHGVAVPPIPFDTTQITSPINGSNPQPGSVWHTLPAHGSPPAIAYGFRHRASASDQAPVLEDLAPTLRAADDDGASVLTRWGVRRTMPVECERLQGFRDGYTLVPYGPRGKLAADAPRYEALGNTIATPPLAWIGRRIAAVDALA